MKEKAPESQDWLKIPLLPYNYPRDFDGGVEWIIHSLQASGFVGTKRRTERYEELFVFRDKKRSVHMVIKDKILTIMAGSREGHMLDSFRVQFAHNGDVRVSVAAAPDVGGEAYLGQSDLATAYYAPACADSLSINPEGWSLSDLKILMGTEEIPTLVTAGR